MKIMGDYYMKCSLIKKACSVIFVLLFLSVLLNFDNFSNWYFANKAMYFDVSYTSSLGDLRYELFESRVSNAEEFYEKKKEYVLKFKKRDVYRKEYKKHHNMLVENDSLLSKCDNMILFFRGSRYDALLSQETVLNNGGDWEQAKKVFSERIYKEKIK